MDGRVTVPRNHRETRPLKMCTAPSVNFFKVVAIIVSTSPQIRRFSSASGSAKLKAKKSELPETLPE